MESSPAALVCDRDGEVRDLIRGALEERGIMTFGADSSAQAIALLNAEDIDLLYVDIESPAPALAGLLARASALTSKPLVIGLLSRQGEAERSKNLDAGIYDILLKPLRRELLRYRTERALRHLEMIAAMNRLRRELQTRAGLQGLVGRSAPMSLLRERLELLAASDCAVWFSGESGSGRELAARTLHASSPRASARFTVIDCQGGGRSELEALCSAPYEQQSGTIYLGELPALPSDLQGALRGMMARLPRNGAEGLPPPAPGPRILAGSLYDAQQAVSQGRLLPALRDLLAGQALRLPALRERPEDIPLLAQHFVSTIARINQLPAIRISGEVLELLEGYHWPGNVRELRNAMEKAVILAVDGTIQSHDLPRAVRERSLSETAGAGSLSERNFKEAKRQMIAGFERAYLSDLMRRFSGNVTGASRHSGMLRSALQRLLRKYDLKSAEFRRRPARGAPRQEAETLIE